MRNRLLLVPLAALVAAVPGCRSGLFEGDGSKWRADDAQLKRIDAMDPAAVSTAPAVSLEDAARKSLDEITVAEPPKDPVSLTIADVRAAALANNLELRTALVDPAIARANLSAEDAKFEGAFFASARRDDNSVFADLASGQATSSDSFEAGFNLPLATGGEIQISSPVTRGADGISFGAPGEDWLAALSLSMSQPLLRGAGVATNTHSIRVAEWQGLYI